MKRVHFIADRSRIVDYLITPVRAARRALRARGYDVRFHYAASGEALSCDILGLVSKAVLEKVHEPKAVICEGSPTLDLLRMARERAAKIIWFDSADSTGVTHFELLPFVDLYLKKQVLKDRELYRRPLYSGRIFTDYYHRKFGVNDREPFTQYYPLLKEFEGKFGLSWNMALGELYYSFSRRGEVRRLLPDLIPARLRVPFTSPFRERPYDLFLRASTTWPRETVAFHRKELIRRLQQLLADHALTGSVSSRADVAKLSTEEYRERMRATKLTFGPFGWGELNLREFEALFFGVLLLRPDSSHMETWPDIFRDRETCAFYRWDFADLEAKILYYLQHDRERQELAEAGQAAYRSAISDAGMETFADWFVQQIEK